MLIEAIKKLKTEIVNSKNDPYIQVVGEFLISQIKNDPSNAEKIMQEGKTIEKSFEEMRKVAVKRKVGNRAVLTDQEGFSIVLKYFGIESTITNTPSKIKEPATEVSGVATVSYEKPNIEFNVELDF